MRLSLCITSKTIDDPKLTALLKSISRQTLKRNLDYEIIVVTDGTSESAKAIGIRKAKGDVICILASDNEFTDTGTLARGLAACEIPGVTGAFPATYEYRRDDPSLNRYFAILGANDPVAWAIGKADRYPSFESVTGTILFKYGIPTLGDNCFFVRRDLILKANLDHYYHIDVCEDLRRLGHYRYAVLPDSIWHKTGDGSILNFLRRRARFGLEHAFNRDRRWHLVERKDTLRLLLFVISSATLVYPTYQAYKWYLKVKDQAVFLHPILCFGMVFTYALVLARAVFNRLSPSLSAHLTGRKA